MVEALHTLGYKNSGRFLEQESGLPLCSNELNLFMQQIIEGQWEESVETLKMISLSLENITITDLSAIMKASVLIYEQKFFEFLDREDIKHLLPTKVMVPKNRLVDLAEKVLDMQKRDCRFHNPSPVEHLSLLSDHLCEGEGIPRRTSQILVHHKDEIWFLKFSHNGQYLASSSRNCVVIIWEVQAGGQLSVIQKLSCFEKPVEQISWSPNDLQFLTCASGQYVLRWDVLSFQLLYGYGKSGLTTVSCGWHPNGDSIFASFNNKTITWWNLKGEELKWCYEGVVAYTRNAYLEIPRNRRELIIMCSSNKIVFLGLESMSIRFIVEDKIIVSFSISGDGKFCLVSLANERIHVYSTEGDHQPKRVAKYKGHKRTRFDVRSCFGGFEERFVASGSEDSQVYIWHRDSGELVHRLEGHGAVVNCVSWNPVNPHMLATGSDVLEFKPSRMEAK
ncbi:hypothetical protein OROHE_022253 [Orobanche hederae]